MAAVNKAERRKRLDEVEQVIQNMGWSGRIARSLAKHMGVDIRTVYRYRAEVLEEIATGYRGLDREHAKGEFLLRLRENMQKAKEAQRWGPVASMLGMEGRLLGVFVEDEQRPPPAANLDEVIDRLKELPGPVRERLAQVLVDAGK